MGGTRPKPKYLENDKYGILTDEDLGWKKPAIDDERLMLDNFHQYLLEEFDGTEYSLLANYNPLNTCLPRENCQTFVKKCLQDYFETDVPAKCENFCKRLKKVFPTRSTPIQVAAGAASSAGRGNQI